MKTQYEGALAITEGPQTVGNAWLFEEVPTRKPVLPSYFIDDYSGITVAEFTEKSKARAFQRKSGGVIRVYAPTLEDREGELAQQREDRRLGI